MGAPPNEGEGGFVHIPIAELLACVDRELGFRAKVYPRWVKPPAPKLTQEAADLEMARMRAVRSRLVRGEATFRVLSKLFDSSGPLTKAICADIDSEVRAILEQHPPS